jgi:hypothetical protein
MVRHPDRPGHRAAGLARPSTREKVPVHLYDLMRIEQQGA